jgi:biotin carboxyl carrier protein
MEMEFSMKYEVTINGTTKEVEISKKDTTYFFRIDNGKEQSLDVERLSSDLMSILHQGRSCDIGHSKIDDGFEIEMLGSRFLAEVVDPNKKSLKLAQSSGGDKVVTRMPGRVIEVCVEVGQEINKGDVVIVIEAMKMENPLKAPRDGVVAELFVRKEDLVNAKQVLLSLE